MNIIDHILNIANSFLQKVADVFPNAVAALFFLLIGWIFAKIVSSIFKRVLVTVKADEFAEKIREVDIFSQLEFKISEVISKVVYWFVFMVFIVMASQALGLDVISDGISSVLAYIPKLLTAIAFFVIGVFVANIIKQVLSAACESMGIAAGRIISLFIFYFLVVVIAITALNQAGLDTTIITQNVSMAMGAIFFAFAIGYGIASKDIMANMLASFYSKDKFSIGQHIKIDAIEGKISDIDSTSVTLEAKDRKIVLPLSKLSTSTVEIMNSVNTE